jgi:hypothetical protein
MLRLGRYIPDVETPIVGQMPEGERRWGARNNSSFEPEIFFQTHWISAHGKTYDMSEMSPRILDCRSLLYGCKSRSFREDADSTEVPQRFKACKKSGYDLQIIAALKPVITGYAIEIMRFAI